LVLLSVQSIEQNIFLNNYKIFFKNNFADEKIDLPLPQKISKHQMKRNVTYRAELSQIGHSPILVVWGK